MMIELPTPCLVVDAEIVRRNIERMQEYANQHQLQLRPHTKTHKSLHVARSQLEAGACGLTVAKVGEAEVLAEACDDLFVAYPAIDPHRCERIATLALGLKMRVAVDSHLAIERLSDAAHRAGSSVSVLVDFDVGYGRTGVQTIEEAVTLGSAISQFPAVCLDGIMIYTGHVSGSNAQQAEAMRQIQSKMEQLFDRWDRAGLSRSVVSSGSTPSAASSHLLTAATEIRPGTYVYNDMNTVHGGYCGIEDCAARIHATVVSNAVKNQVVLDCGSKTLTSDRCGPAPDSGHGLILEYPSAKIVRLTEEHAQVDISDCEAAPTLGERVTIIPNHICVCVNMQDTFWWQEPDAEPQLMAVDTRGRLV